MGTNLKTHARQYIQMSWDPILEDYSGFNEIGLAQVTSKYGHKSWDNVYVQDGKVYEKGKEA